MNKNKNKTKQNKNFFNKKNTAKNKQTKKKPVCNNQNEKCILGHYCQNDNSSQFPTKHFVASQI